CAHRVARAARGLAGGGPGRAGAGARRRARAAAPQLPVRGHRDPGRAGGRVSRLDSSRRGWPRVLDNRRTMHNNGSDAPTSNRGRPRLTMRNSIWRILVVTFAVALVGAFLPFNSASAQSPESCAVDIADYEGSAILTVDPLTVAPGGTVTITGAGFPPNSTVPLSFNGQQFATPVTDDLGAFSVPFTVPADTPPGPVEFEAICGAFTLTSIVQVTGTPATPPPTVPGGDSGGTLT